MNNSKNKQAHLDGKISLGRNSKAKSRWNSGVCALCGKWVDMITQEHAREHGFRNDDEMARAGVVK